MGAITMYTLYFAPTANGHKILIMLEALDVAYRIQRLTSPWATSIGRTSHA